MPISVSGATGIVSIPTAGYMSMPIGDLIDAIALYLRFHVKSTVTTGGTGSFEDSTRGEGPDYWNECFLKGLSGGNIHRQFFVSDWTRPTYTLSPTGVGWAVGDAYRVTSFDQLACLSSGYAKGYIDQAIETAQKDLWSEIEVTGLTTTTGAQEYSFVTIGANATFLQTLIAIEYQPSTSSYWYSLRFHLARDGTSFILDDNPGDGTALRLKGKGYALRTNASDVALSMITSETDKLVVAQGDEHYIVRLVAQLVKTTEDQRGPTLAHIKQDVKESKMAVLRLPSTSRTWHF